MLGGQELTVCEFAESAVSWWVSRDPIGEPGARNLYGFVSGYGLENDSCGSYLYVRNRPVYEWDWLGLANFHNATTKKWVVLLSFEDIKIYRCIGEQSSPDSYCEVEDYDDIAAIPIVMAPGQWSSWKETDTYTYDPDAVVPYVTREGNLAYKGKDGDYDIEMTGPGPGIPFFLYNGDGAASYNDWLPSKGTKPMTAFLGTPKPTMFARAGQARDALRELLAEIASEEPKCATENAALKAEVEGALAGVENYIATGP